MEGENSSKPEHNTAEEVQRTGSDDIEGSEIITPSSFSLMNSPSANASTKRFAFKTLNTVWELEEFGVEVVWKNPQFSNRTFAHLCFGDRQGAWYDKFMKQNMRVFWITLIAVYLTFVAIDEVALKPHDDLKFVAVVVYSILFCFAGVIMFLLLQVDIMKRLVGHEIEWYVLFFNLYITLTGYWYVNSRYHEVWSLPVYIASIPMAIVGSSFDAFGYDIFAISNRIIFYGACSLLAFVHLILVVFTNHFDQNSNFDIPFVTTQISYIQTFQSGLTYTFILMCKGLYYSWYKPGQLPIMRARLRAKNAA